MSLLTNLLIAWQTLQHMHPLGLTDDWADKLADQSFFSPNQKATFEHYMQVRLAGCMASMLVPLATMAQV